MTVVTTFPRAVRELDPIWIPMPDGCRLAARIWLPADAEADPVPAVLEYIPYRRRDFTAQRDALMQPFTARLRPTGGETRFVVRVSDVLLKVTPGR